SSLSLLFSLIRRQPCSPLFPYTTLFRSLYARGAGIEDSSTAGFAEAVAAAKRASVAVLVLGEREDMSGEAASRSMLGLPGVQERSEEHTSELQSRFDLVCRLLLEKKKNI